jgi:hypothetical protein
MTSNINPNGYGSLIFNQNYPTANINQSSQGFRDNFSIIKNNLSIASAEISNLQAATIVFSGDIIGPSVPPPLLNGTTPAAYTLTFKPNPVFTGNISLTLPSGTTSQRPGVPINGMIRYNTDTTAIEFYINNVWNLLGGSQSSYLPITGGTLSGNLILSGTYNLNVGGTINSRIIQNDGAILDNINSGGLGYIVRVGNNSFARQTFNSPLNSVNITNPSGSGVSNTGFDLNIHSLTQKFTPTISDEFIIYETSTASFKKLTYANLTNAIATVQIPAGNYTNSNITIDNQGRISQIVSGTNFSRTFVDSTENIVIPSRYQLICIQNFTIDAGGTLISDGDLVVL